MNIETPPALAKPQGDPQKPSRAEAEAAIRTLLLWAGENPGREGLRAANRRADDEARAEKLV